MKKYKVKIEFVTDYLQGRYSEDAKKELDEYISKGIVKSPEDSWKVFLYEDGKGIYIPSIHFRKPIVLAGKHFKIKKQRRSMHQWCVSNIIIQPDKIYLGKKKPDEIIESYPARKDGNRVKTKHPAFKAGTRVEFSIQIFDDDMEDKAIKNLVETAGQMYGAGTRRPDMFGRFNLVDFKKL